MKTLIKLAAGQKPFAQARDNILFDGSAARATDCTSHAVIENGPWNFDRATLVPITRIKQALALAKKPVWSGSTLNGVDLSNNNDNDFLPLPAIGGTVRLSNPDWASTIAKVLPAAATNDIRYYLVGLCFDGGNVIGCDGHRLHLAQGAYPEQHSDARIIPCDAFTLNSKTINIDLGATHARVSYECGYLITPYVDGRFPDWQRVVPASKDRPRVVSYGAKQIEAVKQALAVAKAARLKWPAAAIGKTGALQLCDMVIPCFDGYLAEYESGFNAQYLLDALVQCHQDGASTIAFGGLPDSALVTGNGITAVVMPCRI